METEIKEGTYVAKQFYLALDPRPHDIMVLKHEFPNARIKHLEKIYRARKIAEIIYEKTVDEENTCIYRRESTPDREFDLVGWNFLHDKDCGYGYRGNWASLLNTRSFLNEFKEYIMGEMPRISKHLINTRIRTYDTNNDFYYPRTVSIGTAIFQQSTHHKSKLFMTNDNFHLEYHRPESVPEDKMCFSNNHRSMVCWGRTFHHNDFLREHFTEQERNIIRKELRDIQKKINKKYFVVSSYLKPDSDPSIRYGHKHRELNKNIEYNLSKKVPFELKEHKNKKVLGLHFGKEDNIESVYTISQLKKEIPWVKEKLDKLYFTLKPDYFYNEYLVERELFYLLTDVYIHFDLNINDPLSNTHMDLLTHPIRRVKPLYSMVYREQKNTNLTDASKTIIHYHGELTNLSKVFNSLKKCSMKLQKGPYTSYHTNSCYMWALPFIALSILHTNDSYKDNRFFYTEKQLVNILMEVQNKLDVFIKDQQRERTKFYPTYSKLKIFDATYLKFLSKKLGSHLYRLGDRLLDSLRENYREEE